jgi:hypothetical protein
MIKTNKIISILFLLLISTSTFSQKGNLQVSSQKIMVGKNYINGSEIEGTELIFPNIIRDFFVDTTNHFLTVQLKGKKNMGNILQYDLQNKEILWRKSIDYETCEFLKFDTLLVFNDYNDSYGINAHTGANLWRVLHYLYYANPKYNIGTAYRFIGDGYTNEFMGIDILKGKQIWKRNINRKYGWNDFFYLNDTTFMVVTAGLHAINIHTGQGWDYNTIVENVNNSDVNAALFGAIVGGILGGIIGGLIGGSLFYYPTVNFSLNADFNVVRGDVSNTFLDGTSIYFASKDKLAKIDKETGNIVWESKLEKDFSSKSSIFIDNITVYMVNYGFAFRGNEQIFYGKPFIAAFDKHTGKQKYLSLCPINKDYIIDYKRIDDNIFLLFPNKIVKYNIYSGALISEKKFSKETFGTLENFSKNNVFLLRENRSFVNLVQYDWKNFHIHTNQNITLSIDKQLNVTNTVGQSNTGNCFLNYSDYKFITSREKTFVINNNSNIIAELNVTSNAFICDGVLYDKRENSFIAIDLKNIISIP